MAGGKGPQAGGKSGGIEMSAEIWTPLDVARSYQVSRRTVGNWCKERRIPYIQVGRTIRFRPEDVAKALARFEIKEAA